MVQLITGLIPAISKLQKEGGGEGRRAITRLTRLISFGWAIIQSSTIAFYLKRALFDWSPLLAFEIIVWLTTGAMIVLWLSELITEYGLGNGASLLIYTNIISSLPNLGKKLINEKIDKKYKKFVIIRLCLPSIIPIRGIIKSKYFHFLDLSIPSYCCCRNQFC